MTPLDKVSRDLMGMQLPGEQHEIELSIPSGSYVRRMVHTSVVAVDTCVSIVPKNCIQRTAKLYHVVWMDEQGNHVSPDLHARLESVYGEKIGDDVA